MAKDKKELTSEEIVKKKSELESKIKSSIMNKKQGRQSPAKKFLTEIKDLVEIAINNGVSYSQLKKDIYDTYSFKISEQTIRSYVKNNIKVNEINKETHASLYKEDVKKETPKINSESGRKKSSIDDI